MSRIRDAIGQLPSWPGFAIAAVVVVLLGGWYYGTSYAQCTEVRDGRERLRAAIERAAASGSGLLDLAADIPGDWDEVRIVEGHRPGQVPLNCPFGWDLTWRERQALVEAGKYTIIGLFKADQFQRYIEYRGDWATFPGAAKAIPRSAARFTVSGAKVPFTLTPLP